MNTQTKTGFTFTGWHMLASMLAFFGTIITVNFTMAYLASSTWSGLVVKNTYVASQEFNGKTAAIRAMLATGIEGELTVDRRGVVYHLTMPDQQVVEADVVTAHFKRPVGEKQNFMLTLLPAGDGRFVASKEILDGGWIVELIASRDGQTIMHEAERIFVAGE
ncbi:FixH family protein [Peteryoungia desertarenae]|uniref:FixH family protein n=1 Tax=Peteryoungia desertarenae TaxID=1813451 RepID=A0ABX6QR04_9HYPH|nr:FixH family protein [Peteryoungia desertarenae]QLF70585.1 FixH family protein [Peteryoungia desertarenae]